MSLSSQCTKNNQWMVCNKGYDTFCPVGPWLVTDLDFSDLEVRTEINGEVRQLSWTSMMIHSIGSIIEWISTITTLLPGDLILTGTPGGAGPIENGDTISITIKNIGTLYNSVIRNK